MYIARRRNASSVEMRCYGIFLKGSLAHIPIIRGRNENDITDSKSGTAVGHLDDLAG
jgi:hypothetical protein